MIACEEVWDSLHITVKYYKGRGGGWGHRTTVRRVFCDGRFTNYGGKGSLRDFPISAGAKIFFNSSSGA